MAAPAAITWDVSADFARTGGGTYATQLRSYIVAPFTFRRGVDSNTGNPIAGSVSFVLDNKSGIFTRGFTTGALYGKLLPGVPIRIKKDAVEVWFGRIRSYTPSVDFQSVTIQCEGELSTLGRQMPTVAVAASTARDSDGGASQALLSVGRGAADEQFTDGIVDLAYHWIDYTKSAAANIADAARCEMATYPNWHEYWAGATIPRVRFLAQNSALHTTPYNVGDDSATVKPALVMVEDRYEDRIGGVRVNYTQFVTAANAWVFIYPKNSGNPTPDSISIPSKGTVVVAGAYITGLAVSVIAPVGVTNYEAREFVGGTGIDYTSSVTVRSFADRGSESVTVLYNDAAVAVFLTDFRLRGTSVTKTKAFVEFNLALLDDPAAPVTTIDLPFVPDLTKIQKFANSYLFPRRMMRPLYSWQLNGATDENQTAILTGQVATVGAVSEKLGALVNLKDTNAALLGSYVNDFVRVESEEITVTAPGMGSAPVVVGKFTGRPSWSYVNPGACIFDWFDRPDSTGLGTTPTGDVWTALLNNFNVVSGKARPNNVAGSISTFSLGAANFSAFLRLSNLTSDTDELVGYIFRYVDGNNYWLLYWSDVTDKFVLSKLVAGSTTTVANPAFTPRADGVMEIFLVCQGDRIRVNIDGQWIIDQADPNLNTNTKHGFFGQNTLTVDFGPVWIAGA